MRCVIGRDVRVASGSKRAGVGWVKEVGSWVQMQGERCDCYGRLDGFR